MYDPVSSYILKIRALIDDALKSLGLTDKAEYSVEYSAISAYGEFSSNVSFVYSKYADLSPAELSVQISEKIKKDPLFDSVSSSYQGFLNFQMSSNWYMKVLSDVQNESNYLGTSDIPSGDAVIITLDDPQTSKTDPYLFRNEAVVLALQSILHCKGYNVTRQKSDSLPLFFDKRAIICAPSRYWDSGAIPAELSAVAEHVVVSECIFRSSDPVWNESLILSLNEQKPQTPIIVDKNTYSKAVYDYAWICSLIRSFGQAPAFPAENIAMTPESSQERLLFKYALLFPSVISKAADDLDPSAVFRYLSDVVINYRLLRDEYGRSEGLAAAKSYSLFWYTSLVKQILKKGLSLFTEEPYEYL